MSGAGLRKVFSLICQSLSFDAMLLNLLLMSSRNHSPRSAIVREDSKLMSLGIQTHS